MNGGRRTAVISQAWSVPTRNPLTSAAVTPAATVDVQAAVQAGIAREAVADIGAGRDPASLPANERALVRFVVALLDMKMDDAIFAAMRAHFSPRQVTDVAISATYYAAIGRMVLAFDVEVEGQEVLQVERDWQRGRT